MLKFLSDLYLKPLSFFFWISRFVYLGILAGGLYFFDKFYGEFNLYEPVDPLLIRVTLMGLVLYELGAWIGWLRRYKPQKGHWLKPIRLSVPLLIWSFALLLSVILFARQGIPLLTDPMSRAQLGVGMGIYKRAMVALLPVACLEIYCIHLQTRRHLWLSIGVLFVTLAILLLYSAKSTLFYQVIYIFLVYYIYRLRYRPHWWRKVINFRTLFIGFVLIGVLYLYDQLALSRMDQSFQVAMTARVTSMLANSPNYIISDLRGVPSTGELLKNEVANVLQVFRIPSPWSVRQLDAEITTAILGRTVEAGGLNPTVIGYGWILGGWFGVGCLSFIYGYWTSKFVKQALRSQSPLAISLNIFAAVGVFNAAQIFSPIIVFLDTGISLLLYLILHRLLEMLLVKLARYSAKTQTQTSVA